MIEQKAILQWPHPLLQKELNRVGDITDHVKQVAAELTKTCLLTGALGLTANQIGYDLAMFSMITDNGVDVVIDPIITERRGPLETKKEGCMSLAKVDARIARQVDITVCFRKLDGVIETKTLTGLPARVFQHEYDHTLGIMIFDHMPKILRQFTLNKFYKKR